MNTYETMAQEFDKAAKLIAIVYRNYSCDALATASDSYGSNAVILYEAMHKDDEGCYTFFLDSLLSEYDDSDRRIIREALLREAAIAVRAIT